MKLGLIARGDRGGLGIQTWEFFRHMRPDATLVVDLGRDGRGVCDREKYLNELRPWKALGFPDATGVDGRELHVVTGYPTDDDLAWLCSRSDVVFTCEAAYNDRLPEIAREHACDVVVQANPELFRGADWPGCRVVAPTPWELPRIPGAQVLPVPVARDVLPYRPAAKAEVFYHPTAPAMLDRNGTNLVVAALRHIHANVTIVFRGPPPNRRVFRHVPKNVRVEWLAPYEGPYFDAYPDEADVLLLPRRYGGLCLPIQEAASLGMPVVTLDLEPQRSYPHAVLAQTTTSTLGRMKGGNFAVHDTDPVLLASAIRTLVDRPELVRELSVNADEWSEKISWSSLVGRYRSVLFGHPPNP